MNRARIVPLVAGVAAGALLTGLVMPSAIEGNGKPDALEVSTGVGSGSGGPDGDTSAAIAASDSSAGAGVADTSGGVSSGTARATGGAGPSGSKAGSSGTSAGTGTAEPGVTDDTVKIGFLLLDVGQLSRFGVSAPVVDPELLRGAYQAYVDELNDRGGFHGRRLEAFYRTFDLTSAESQRAACLGLIEDEGVFAVIGEFPNRAANLCVTQEHGRPFLTPALAGVADDVFDASKGLLFSLYPRGSRQMTDLANDLHRMGKLTGKKVGIVNQRSNDPAGAMGDILQSTLQRLGHAVVHRADFSADNAEAASQVPIEVQQMRTKGAEVILLMANTLVNSQFTQAADNQGWHPTYFMGDWNYMNTDTAAQNLPRSMDGTLGLTYGRAYEWRANMPEGPMTKTCIDIYERHTGKTTTRPELSYQSVAFACAHAGQLRAGFEAAGRALTSTSFSNALQAAGDIPETAAWWAPGHYAPRKFDFVDQLRTQVWKGSCRCWHPTGPFRTPSSR